MAAAYPLVAHQVTAWRHAAPLADTYFRVPLRTYARLTLPAVIRRLPTMPRFCTNAVTPYLPLTCCLPSRVPFGWDLRARTFRHGSLFLTDLVWLTPVLDCSYLLPVINNAPYLSLYQHGSRTLRTAPYCKLPHGWPGRDAAALRAPPHCGSHLYRRFVVRIWLAGQHRWRYARFAPGYAPFNAAVPGSPYFYALRLAPTMAGG